SDFQPDLGQPSSGLLVKKWTSVIRMQKRVSELEHQISQVQEEMRLAGTSGGVSSKKQAADWLPTSSSCKAPLTGHRDGVNAVAFHPKYTVLASASDDCTVIIWDWESGEREMTLKAHTKRVSDAQYNSAGTMLVTCSYDLFIKLWNVEDGYKNVATLRGHEHSISSARWIPGDDKIVSSSRDHSVRVWDVGTTHCIKVIRAHDDWIRGAVPSSDGRFFLTCSADHTAKITDAATGELKAEFRGHDNVVEAAQFAPPNAVAAICELAGIKPNATTTGPVVFAATASRDKTVKIWDAQRGALLYTLKGHDDWVRSIVFHPSGQYLLTASDDHRFKVWDLGTGRCVRTVQAHEQFVAGMSWGRMQAAGKGVGEEGQVVNVLATCSSDKTVKIWVPAR
ncbi:dynein regulator, partial [Cylindrobasidium torrendii FP15055 ss-10]